MVGEGETSDPLKKNGVPNDPDLPIASCSFEPLPNYFLE
jgi:hypothetical protein